MEPIALNGAQARRFVLRWQGLLGPRRFAGGQGVAAYTRQAGCIQYDPVDVCGKNAEIVLFSRVKGFTKATLARVLYKNRTLLENWDKNMSIYPAEDWPALWRFRTEMADWYRVRRGLADRPEVLENLTARLKKHRTVCGKDLEDMGAAGRKSWGPTRLSTAGLEYLYFTGAAVIHHREGAQRHYALAEKHLPAELLAAPDPHPATADYHAWHTLRRIGAVGLLWNRPSDAWLCIPEYKAPRRAAAFAALLARGDLLECAVEGIPHPLYAPAAARPVLDEILAGEKYAPRCEFIAPLDSLMWDRRLIKALFGFEYTWEIYTPAAKRQYGHYVLPVLDGEGFAGRIELRCDRKTGTLAVHHWWPEAGVKPRRGFTGRLTRQIERFAAFNGCRQVTPLPGCALPGMG